MMKVPLSEKTITSLSSIVSATGRISHSLTDMEFRGYETKCRLLVWAIVVIHFCTTVDAQASCKLKAKFNLNGYKSLEKKKVIVGGMFSVHKSLASADSNTTSEPISSGCEG